MMTMSRKSWEALAVTSHTVLLRDQIYAHSLSIVAIIKTVEGIVKIYASDVKMDIEIA